MTYDVISTNYLFSNDNDERERVFYNLGWCMYRLNNISDIENDRDIVHRAQKNKDIIEATSQIFKDVKSMLYPDFDTPTAYDVIEKSPIQYDVSPDGALDSDFWDGMYLTLIDRASMILSAVATERSFSTNFECVNESDFDDDADYYYLVNLLQDMVNYLQELVTYEPWSSKISDEIKQGLENVSVLYRDNEKARKSRKTVREIVDESSLVYEDIDADNFSDEYEFSNIIESVFISNAADLLCDALYEVDQIIHNS